MVKINCFMKKLSKNIFSIIVVSALLGLLFNFINPSGISLVREQSDLVSADDSILSEQNTGYEAADSSGSGGEIFMINLEQSYKLYLSQKILFIDARDQWEYTNSHIKGAVNIPEYKFNNNDPFINSLDKSKSYVLYCDGDDCDVSKRLARDLKNMGFLKIYVFEGGFFEWNNNKYPVEKSSE